MKNYLKNLGSIAALVCGLMLHSPAAHASTLSFACANANQGIVTSGGDQFTADSSGLVTGVKSGNQATSLVSQGCNNLIIPAAFSGTDTLVNPPAQVVVGSSTTAAINAGGNTILTGIAGHTIYVVGFDLVASGTPATCTGVYLEDSAGSPVVAATVLVAALGSGVHALPLAANTGAGFGSGGLTAGDNLQLNVDGSACITMTKMTYAISYIVL